MAANSYWHQSSWHTLRDTFQFRSLDLTKLLALTLVEFEAYDPHLKPPLIRPGSDLYGKQFPQVGYPLAKSASFLEFHVALGEVDLTLLVEPLGARI